MIKISITARAVSICFTNLFCAHGVYSSYSSLCKSGYCRLLHAHCHGSFHERLQLVLRMHSSITYNFLHCLRHISYACISVTTASTFCTCTMFLTSLVCFDFLHSFCKHLLAYSYSAFIPRIFTLFSLSNNK